MNIFKHSDEYLFNKNSNWKESNIYEQFKRKSTVFLLLDYFNSGREF